MYVATQTMLLMCLLWQLSFYIIFYNHQVNKLIKETQKCSCKGKKAPLANKNAGDEIVKKEGGTKRSSSSEEEISPIEAVEKEKENVFIASSWGPELNLYLLQSSTSSDDGFNAGRIVCQRCSFFPRGILSEMRIKADRCKLIAWVIVYQSPPTE